MSQGRRSLSLRARIMMIIVGGAVLPLVALGAWLTAAASRSGRDLLQRELEASLTAVSARVTERWTHRAAELALLTNNEPARRVLGSGAVDAEAALYFQELARGLRLSVREFAYRDAAGRQHWTSIDAARGPQNGSPGEGERGTLAGFNNRDAILLRRAITTEDGDSLGVLEARFLLSAILPADSVQLIVAGAALRVTNRENGETIGAPGTETDSADRIITRTSLADPPLDLELAASDSRYVQPFHQAARLGLLVLVMVTLVTLGLTTYLTRRLTGSLEQLVDAAGAVAAGDLQRSVSSKGAGEIGRLASAFNTMTESLRRTLRELSRREALAAVGGFAAAMSHEVRNALTAVRLDLQRLSERNPTSTEDRALLQRTLGNVARLDSIVTGSLRIARTDPETMRSLLLEGVVRTAVSASESSFVESGATAHVTAAEEGLRVRGDAGALEQMFVNLLMNAAQAMASGGTARISLARVNGHAEVHIVDTGRGIPSETLARLGERFFSTRSSGTGLGFAIAREIAAVHGGDIQVTSTSSEGTTVRVTLPTEAGDGRREI